MCSINGGWGRGCGEGGGRDRRECDGRGRGRERGDKRGSAHGEVVDGVVSKVGEGSRLIDPPQEDLLGWEEM